MAEQRDWLTRYVSIQQVYDAKLDVILQQAAQDARRAAEAEAKKRQTFSSRVHQAQLKTSQMAIQRMTRSLWVKVGNMIKAGMADAQIAALDQSFSWDEVLLKHVFKSKAERDTLHRGLIQTADRNVEAMIARVLGGRIALSSQVYKTQALSNGWVERAINSGLARGASPREIAKTVKDFVDPKTKGGVSYAARRLARTEINNAYHAQSVATNEDKPWVSEMIWSLSKSHPKPDVCDRLAANSPYPRNAVPKKAHPQCLCYTYPKLVTPEEFINGYFAGQYDDWIDQNYSPRADSPGRTVA